MNTICCVLLIFSVHLIISIEGACQSLDLLNDPDLINCPQCRFVNTHNLFSGSGKEYTITCPEGHHLWWYQHSHQFTSSTSDLGTKYHLSCAGSTWKLTIPNKPTVNNLDITAIACGDKR